MGCRPLLANLVGRGRGAAGSGDGESNRAAGVRGRRADAPVVCGKRIEGYEGICMTLGPEIVFTQGFVQSDLHRLIFLITHFSDQDAAERIRGHVALHGNAASITNYLDVRGNNLLWYLTYRDDQNARGGFACPCIDRELLRIGVDPNRRNNIGLCWNDVKRHVIRPNL